MNKIHHASLYLFYTVYFLSMGATSFQSKYFGELGMSDSQIGMLTSIPAILAIVVQPVWGMFADRARYKRNILAIAAVLVAAASFLTDNVRAFGPMMACMTLLTATQLPITPIASSISMDYVSGIGRTFGPIRLCGTLGYQLGALIIGAALTHSLQGLFAIVGWIMLASAACTLIMPPVRGYQHDGAKVSPVVLLRDPNTRILLLMVLIAATTSMFSQSFLAKRMGDLGMDNQVVSYITILSIVLELPFLIFSGKLRSKLTIWNWFILGMLLNGVRFIGLAFANNAISILICSLPSVSVLACFEFFPALYLNDRASPELHGSVQTLLMLVNFCIARITGSLLEGFLCDHIGIPSVFMLNGLILLSAAIAFYAPCKRMAMRDSTLGVPVV